MTELIYFLLARIAEDAERATFVASQIEGNNWQPFEQWKLSWHDEYDLLCIEPARALAEVEAKRQILDISGPAQTGGGDLIPGSGIPDIWQALALPYADHPDYREEWRQRARGTAQRPHRSC